MSRRFICPDCCRELYEYNGRLPTHTDAGQAACPMAGQPVPESVIHEAVLEKRAGQVLDMAVNLRDEDPRHVRRALAHAPREVLEQWALIGLAGIDVDRPATEIFAWVYGLDTTGARK